MRQIVDRLVIQLHGVDIGQPAVSRVVCLWRGTRTCWSATRRSVNWESTVLQVNWFTASTSRPAWIIRGVRWLWSIKEREHGSLVTGLCVRRRRHIASALSTAHRNKWRKGLLIILFSQ